MSKYQESFGFEDETLNDEIIECFKGEKDKVDRLSIIFYEIEAKTFIKVLKDRGMSEESIQNSIKQRIKNGTTEQVTKDDGKMYFRFIKWSSGHFHYDEANKKIFMCLDPKKKDKICCKKLGDPKKKSVTVVAVYRTDKYGKVVDPIDFDVKPWRVAPKRLRQLTNKDDKFPLIKHDIEFTCTDAKFQNADIEIYPNQTPLWRSTPELEKKALDKAEGLWPILGTYIGQDLDEEDVRALLLGESSRNSSNSSNDSNDSSDDINLDDALNSF